MTVLGTRGGTLDTRADVLDTRVGVLVCCDEPLRAGPGLHQPLLPGSFFSIVTSVNRGPTFALRRSALDFGLGGQRSQA